MKKVFFLLMTYFISFGKDIQTPFTRYSDLGGIDIPTAYILPHGNFNYIQTYNLGFSSEYHQSNALSFSFSFGLYNYFQINVSHYQSHYIAFNIEAKLIDEDFYYYFPAIAVGIENIGGGPQFTKKWEIFWNQRHYLTDDYDMDFEKNTFYIVFSKKFTFKKQFIAGHFGYSPNKGRFYGFGPKNWFLKKFFVGIEYSPFSSMRFIFEQDARDWNVGIKYKINNLVSIDAAVTELEHLDDWVGGNFHIAVSFYLVPNFIAIKQHRKLYNQIIQRRIEEANRLDKLYNELLTKRLILENKLKEVNENLNRILINSKIKEIPLLYERQLFNESDYYLKIALQLMYLEEYEKAKEYCQKAISIYPKNPFGYLRLGEIYIKEGKKDKAIEIWKEGLLKNPGNENLIKAIQRHQK